VIDSLVGIAVPLILGCAMGSFYFAGLWWTVQRLPLAWFPGLITLGSFVLRAGVMILGFLMIGRGGHWERMLFALVGVILARVVLVAKIRPRRETEGV